MIETPVETEQTKERRYCDINIINSRNVILLSVVRETWVLQVNGEWTLKKKDIADYVTLDNDIRIDPDTLILSRDNGNPALDYVHQRFATEWTNIGFFAEQVLSNNGKI